MSASEGIRDEPAPGHIVYLVARREFVLRVEGKTFRLGTALIIFLLAGYVLLQGHVLNKSGVTTAQRLTSVTAHGNQQKVVGFIVAFVLYIALAIYGNLVAQGVVEEKANRIVEILLATIRPSQLLLGKVVGIGLVGLLQLAIIGAAGLILIAASHVITIPSFGVGVVAEGLLWFVLGFVLYAILYATAGSLVSRQEDSQMVTLPITMGLVVAYVVGLTVVLRNPSSVGSTVLSLLPPLAPVLMPLRVATGDAAAWQVVLAIVLIGFAIGAAIRLAARVYATSVLRTGARISLREALRSS